MTSSVFVDFQWAESCKGAEPWTDGGEKEEEERHDDGVELVERIVWVDSENSHDYGRDEMGLQYLILLLLHH